MLSKDTLLINIETNKSTPLFSKNYFILGATF